MLSRSLILPISPMTLIITMSQAALITKGSKRSSLIISLITLTLTMRQVRTPLTMAALIMKGGALKAGIKILATSKGLRGGC